MQYPGGKGKVYQRLINLMPPHEVYIESHLGGGAVMRNKRPASINIGIDLDIDVIDRWRRESPGLCSLLHTDANAYLATYPFTGRELVYADPPYVPEVRRRAKVYRYDYSAQQHRDLLSVLGRIPALVMLSGYDSPMYNEALAGWRKVTFDAKTHVDVRTECVWINFDAPKELHDWSHVGDTFRERQTIRRRHARLMNKLAAMDPLERRHLLALLDAQFGTGRGAAAQNAPSNQPPWPKDRAGAACASGDSEVAPLSAIGVGIDRP